MTNDLYIIDPSVADYQALIAALPAGSPWYLLDANRDGLEQILALLADHADIPALHILSHGSTGTLYLGNTVVNASTLDSYAATLAGIGSHLSASSDILLYGCDVAAGTIGQDFIDRIAALTGADVAASTDLTGAGGDWTLEASSGALEAATFSSTDYVGTLATLTGGEGNDTITGTTNADTINARGGDDYVDAGAGDDTIEGGDGEDILIGGDGNDIITDSYGFTTVFGGSGNDIITTQNTLIQEIHGGSGSDTIAGNGLLYGEAGNDEITIWWSSDFGGFEASGGSGDDVIYHDLNGDGYDYSHSYILDGGEGYDRLVIGGENSPMEAGNPISNCIGFEEIVFDISAGFMNQSGFTNSVVAPGSEVKVIINKNAEIDASMETDGHFNFIVNGSCELVISGQLSDQFHGGKNAEHFQGNGGDDYIDGGDGIDTAIFSGVRANYVITEVTYNTFTVQDTVGNDGTDTIVDVNKLQFSDQTIDVIISGLKIVGDGTAEVISGGTNADYIDGAGGNDTLNGLAGNDTLEGGDGADNLSGASGNDFLNGGDGNDQVTGGLGSDTIESGNGDDTVDAGDGNDLIVGGNGAGNDTYKGGAGNDTVKYTSALASVTVDLSAASNQAISTAGGDAAGIGTDQLSGIESIIAGNFNDRLTGNAANNRLDGWLGADAMMGLAGNDTYVVDNASDRVYETTTKAGSTDAGGTDTVQSSISLNIGAYTGISFVEKLVLTGSANINGVGNDLANTITGNGGKNTLNGAAGNDSLNGGAGNDILIGGAGNDTLIGGLGLDRFRFNTALGGSNIDTIKGFATADDTIQLDDAVFAGIGPLGALAADAFVAGAAALDANDRIIFNSGTGALLYDADGSGAGSAVQFATISGLTGTVTASDFVII